MSNTNNQTIKKVRIDTSAPEFNSLTEGFIVGLAEDNHCPQDAIDTFWSKYTIFGCRDLLLQMSITSDIGIERSGCFSENQEDIEEFYDDVYELFGAIYFEHRYNTGKPKIVFVKEGEDEVV